LIVESSSQLLDSIINQHWLAMVSNRLVKIHQASVVQVKLLSKLFEPRKLQVVFTVEGMYNLLQGPKTGI
jgi:hypothetical protein